MAINKKSTIFVLFSWNFGKVIASWVDYFHQVSWGLNKNCGFFINGQLFNVCDFFLTQSLFAVCGISFCSTYLLTGLSVSRYQAKLNRCLRYKWLILCSHLCKWWLEFREIIENSDKKIKCIIDDSNEIILYVVFKESLVC